jgi:hypothetical protein
MAVPKRFDNMMRDLRRLRAYPSGAQISTVLEALDDEVLVHSPHALCPGRRAAEELAQTTPGSIDPGSYGHSKKGTRWCSTCWHGAGLTAFFAYARSDAAFGHAEWIMAYLCDQTTLHRRMKEISHRIVYRLKGHQGQADTLLRDLARFEKNRLPRAVELAQNGPDLDSKTPMAQAMAEFRALATPGGAALGAVADKIRRAIRPGYLGVGEHQSLDESPAFFAVGSKPWLPKRPELAREVWAAFALPTNRGGILLYGPRFVIDYAQRKCGLGDREYAVTAAAPADRLEAETVAMLWNAASTGPLADLYAAIDAARQVGLGSLAQAA